MPAFVAAIALAVSAGCGVTDPSATDHDPALTAEWDAWPARSDSLVYHLRREPGEYRAYATVTLRNRTAFEVRY